MIKSKNNIEDLIKEVKNFKYFKDTAEVDVCLKEDESISIRYDTPKCIIINLFDYEKAISALYKDRKYINQHVF